MCRERRERKAAEELVRASRARRVLIEVTGGDSAPLAEGEEEAVKALLAYALEFCPAVEAADGLQVQELMLAGHELPEVRRMLGADHLLRAEYSPGFQRRNWRLTLSREAAGPWTVQARCGVDDESPDGLAPLWDGAMSLLTQAAPSFGADPPDEPAAAAPAEAWALLARARAAERNDEWADALAASEEALAAAGEEQPVATIAAFYRTVAEARASGRFPPAAVGDAEEASPQTAGLARMLTALAAGDPADVEGRAADYLSEFPDSPRGYLLLGLWRLHGEGSADRALVAFRHAVDLDPAYMPAAHECVGLMARLQPDALDEFLAGHRERVADKTAAFRLARYAEEAKARQGAQ
jgi:tetratricopeptide (TPR) repeat protein